MRTTRVNTWRRKGSTMRRKRVQTKMVKDEGLNEKGL